MIPQVPEGLAIRAVYAPPENMSYESWIAQLMDLRFARAGRVLGLCGFAVFAAAILVPGFVGGINGDLAFGGLLLGLLVVAVGGLLMVKGGRSGYYDVRDDGSLGERLGREEVDLNGWTPIPLDGQSGRRQPWW